LLDDPPLTDWLERLRSACRDKDKTPARYQSALRNLDRAVYEFATRAQTDAAAERRALLDVLRALGRAERTLATGLRFCKEKGIRPLQRLNPQWLLTAAPAGDGGREYRLAAALASVRPERKTSDVGSFRTHLEEVEQKGKWVDWSPGNTSAVWSNRSLADNLAAVFLRRWVESEQAGQPGLALRTWLSAPVADVVAFLSEGTDDDLLADLIWGFAGLDWSADWFRARANRRAVRQHLHVPDLPVPPQEFGLLRLVVRPVGLVATAGPQHGPAQGRELQWKVAKPGEVVGLETKPAATSFHLLQRGDVPGAVAAAARRLWAARLLPFGWASQRRQEEGYPTDSRLDSARLLAACLFPLSPAALTSLARQALSPPDPAS
jgi:CRISPR-associated protein Csx17